MMDLLSNVRITEILSSFSKVLCMKTVDISAIFCPKNRNNKKKLHQRKSNGIIMPLTSYYVINQALNGGKAINILDKVKNYREEENRLKWEGHLQII